VVRKTLIPILGAIIRTRDRKEIHRDQVVDWYKQWYNTEDPLEIHVRHLHVWIADYTSGRFYLGPKLVAFEDEKDFVVFSLWYKNYDS